MFFAPPYIWPSIELATAAAAFAQTTDVLIPAPGAGFALRIVGIVVDPSYINTGGLHLRFDDGITGNRWLVFDFLPGAGRAVPIMFPEPGILLPVNASARCVTQATIASQHYSTTIYYYIDPVT